MLTIIWDVDDVLNDLMRNWLENDWIPRHPQCFLTYDDLTENPPHQLLKISRTKYLDSLDSFRLSDGFKRMNPVPQVSEWFMRNGAEYRHIALTATPLHTAANSSSWVISNFGRWIRTFHFVPSARPQYEIPDYDRDKSEFLTWLAKGDIFIDDNPENVLAARKLGLKAILFPRPWNRANGTIEETLNQISY